MADGRTESPPFTAGKNESIASYVVVMSKDEKPSPYLNKCCSGRGTIGTKSSAPPVAFFSSFVLFLLASSFVLEKTASTTGKFPSDRSAFSHPFGEATPLSIDSREGRICLLAVIENDHDSVHDFDSHVATSCGMEATRTIRNEPNGGVPLPKRPNGYSNYEEKYLLLTSP